MANCEATFSAQSPFTKQEYKIQIKEELTFSFEINIKYLSKQNSAAPKTFWRKF